jgi:hypothetical protein
MLYFPRPLTPETKNNAVKTLAPLAEQYLLEDSNLWQELLDCLKTHKSSLSDSRYNSSENDDRHYQRSPVRKNPIARAEKQYHGDGYFRG